MKPSSNTIFLIHQLASTLARQNDEILQAKLGIGFSQFKILMVLTWKPNIRQKEIADELGQTEASVSRQIKIMYDDGLLQSTQRPENRREHVTVLTARGVRVSEQAMRVLNKHYESKFGRLSQVEQAKLHQTLQTLNDQF